MGVSQLFNTLLFTQQQEDQEVRVSELFNTLLFTQQQEKEQEVGVSQLFNTLLFTQQEEQEEQEVRVSQLFNTLLFTQQEVRVSQLLNTLLFTQQQEQEEEQQEVMIKMFISQLVSLLSLTLCSSLPSLPPLPRITPFLFNKSDNSSITINNWTGVLSQGQLKWPNVTASPAKFHVLSSLLSQHEVDSIVDIVQSPNLDLDVDLDSVDMSSTYEFYISRNGNSEGIKDITGKLDHDKDVFDKRTPIRDELSEIMNPIIHDRILPFVNDKYVKSCSLSNASCTVCHSLVCDCFDYNILCQEVFFYILCLYHTGEKVF